MDSWASQPDEALIAAAQHNDAQAYGALVCRHRDGVVRVVYRMCGDPSLSEEAAQEAFIRAWQHLSTYRAGHSFRAWVYRIAINAALDSLRRERPAQSLDDDDIDLPDPEDNVERSAEVKERSKTIRAAVMQLSAPNRAVLVLREYGGLSYAEIAASLAIPLGTVMSRLNSARAQLKTTLASLMEVG